MSKDTFKHFLSVFNSPEPSVLDVEGVITKVVEVFNNLSNDSDIDGDTAVSKAIELVSDVEDLLKDAEEKEEEIFVKASEETLNKFRKEHKDKDKKKKKTGTSYSKDDGDDTIDIDDVMKNEEVQVMFGQLLDQLSKDINGKSLKEFLSEVDKTESDVEDSDSEDEAEEVDKGQDKDEVVWESDLSPEAPPILKSSRKTTNIYTKSKKKEEDAEFKFGTSIS